MKGEIMKYLTTLICPIFMTSAAIHAEPLNTSSAPRPQEKIKTLSKEENRAIGSAKMLADKTIILHLRAETSELPPSIGQAQFIYKPADPKYAEIVQHVGGLKPGEEKTFMPLTGKQQ